MKTKKLKLMTFVAILSLGVVAILQPGCTKEGPEGPAGTNGTNGVDANAVSAADQAAYNAADGAIGARLYDHVISEANITNPAIRNYPNFFRCKQCHGWDLRGSKGAYINRAANSTRPEVAPNDIYMFAKQHNIREIFDAVKHTGGTKSVATSYTAAMPDYGLLITDAQIWQIVKFLKNDAHNFSDFYDMTTTGSYPTGTVTFSNIGKGGDAVAGQATYTAKCAGCHGANGKQIDVYCQGEFIGTFCRSNPHELQHKAKWGMPMDIDHPTCTYAGQMSVFTTITDQDIRNIMTLGQDTLVFPN